MKLNKVHIIITVSSIALAALLLLQFKWILETAQIKEQLFNEKAGMVLAKATEALKTDLQMCRTIEKCAANSTENNFSTSLGTAEQNKIDSIFSYYMKFYHIHLNYSYELRKDEIIENITNSFSNHSYNQQVSNSQSANGFNLKLNLPQKKDYIVAELGTLFFSSLILIIIVIILVRYTIISLLKEKSIAEHATDFLNNMTHEFKTPLTNISLAGKMILKDAPASTKTHQYTEIIIKENEKLRLQVEQMLSMTALERGEIPVSKHRLDFHHLISESLQYMKLQIDEKNANVEYHSEAKYFMIEADREHCINALCNLLDNALKYSLQNPLIKIYTFNHENKFCITISDNGIGIEKKYENLVFDKFFRIPKGDMHNVKGFGLGLAYVKKIVALHHGEIQVKSENNSTTFIISLPYV